MRRLRAARSIGHADGVHSRRRASAMLEPYAKFSNVCTRLLATLTGWGNIHRVAKARDRSRRVHPDDIALHAVSPCAGLAPSVEAA
jgi:hypothetical protein